jgi:hypothetical protein
VAGSAEPAGGETRAAVLPVVRGDLAVCGDPVGRRNPPAPTVVVAVTIPYLQGSLLFAHCAEVYLRHQPLGDGACACGRCGCRRRHHAIAVIEAAGVDPATITADDTLPRPWHERPVRPDGPPPAAPRHPGTGDFGRPAPRRHPNVSTRWG